MATDVEALINNLTTFYEFSGKKVIHVGAGGGQLILYARGVGRVLAVDSDAGAVEQLKKAVASEGLGELFDFVLGDFASVNERGDVVFFEFCLHEMDDPAEKVAHALDLAPDVLIIDHDRDSKWAWHACETEKVEVSWLAVEQFEIARSQGFSTTQVFETFAQLIDKISCLGEPAIARAEQFAGATGISIPMLYRVALLKGTTA